MPLTMEELSDLAAKARQAVEVRKRDKAQAQRKVDAAVGRVQEAKSHVDHIAKVLAFFGEVGDVSRAAAKEQAEMMLTQAVQAVYGDTYSVAIELSTRAGRPEATIKIKTALNEELSYTGEPTESKGGGVVDVLTTAIRIMLLEGSSPANDGPLLLDEPGKHISSEFIEGFAAFLVMVCAEFDRQIIMVTHNTQLAEVADKSYTVRLENGQSVAVEVARFAA